MPQAGFDLFTSVEGLPGAFSRAVREIIETTIQCHSKDCLFERDAVEKAARQVEEQRHSYRGKDDLIDAIREAIRAVELVCPAEGVDRCKLLR